MKDRVIQSIIDLVLLPLVGISVCLILWCAASALTYDSKAKRSILPNPADTVRASAKYLVAPFSHDEEQGVDGLGLLALQSLGLVMKGYLAALVVAVPIGFMLGGSKLFTKCFDPIFQILRPVSPLAWYPLAGVIMVSVKKTYYAGADATTWQCILTIGICSLWPTVMNTAVGVRAIPQDYLNVAKVLQLGRFKTFTKIQLPAALPYMFTGFRLSLGIAWLVIVACEMLSGKAGIGFFVNDSYNADDYGSMIMSILIIGVVGFLLDRLMSVVEKNIDLVLNFPTTVRHIVSFVRPEKRSQAHAVS